MYGWAHGDWNSVVANGAIWGKTRFHETWIMLRQESWRSYLRHFRYLMFEFQGATDSTDPWKIGWISNFAHLKYIKLHYLKLVPQSSVGLTRLKSTSWILDSNSNSYSLALTMSLVASKSYCQSCVWRWEIYITFHYFLNYLLPPLSMRTPLCQAEKHAMTRFSRIRSIYGNELETRFRRRW